MTGGEAVEIGHKREEFVFEFRTRACLESSSCGALFFLDNLGPFPSVCGFDEFFLVVGHLPGAEEGFDAEKAFEAFEHHSGVELEHLQETETAREETTFVLFDTTFRKVFDLYQALY